MVKKLEFYKRSDGTFELQDVSRGFGGGQVCMWDFGEDTDRLLAVIGNHFRAALRDGEECSVRLVHTPSSGVALR